VDIWLLNTEMEIIHFLDTYESLLWTERYYECGDFEIFSTVTDQLLSLFQPGYYLWSKESDEVMVVEDREISSDAEEGNRLTITGRSLESLLERRVVWGEAVLSGSLQDGVKKLIDENIISPTMEERKIENFIFEVSDDPKITELTVDATYYGETLYQVVSTLCKNNGIGFRIRLTEDFKFAFSLYAGQDRSYDQIENPYVVFSPQFENIINSNYLESTKLLKTVAFVAGAGDNATRTTMAVPAVEGEKLSGVERREVFVDAGGVNKETEGKTLSDEEYKAQLKQKAMEYFTDNCETRAFEGKMETTRTFQYGVDFFKGDIVQIANEYGVEAKTRIVELVISQDANGLEVYPTFETIPYDK